jgi:hypothetical protein
MIFNNSNYYKANYYNEKTIKVIEDAENGEGLLSCNSTDNFFKELQI